MNFDIFPDRYKERCRKWDKEKINGEFGTVFDDYIPMWIADIYVHHNYLFAAAFIREKLPEISFMEMESSYLLWMNIEPTGLSSDAFIRGLARDFGVLLENGNHFTGAGHEYVRVNLGTQKRLVREGFLRIQRFLNR